MSQLDRQALMSIKPTNLVPKSQNDSFSLDTKGMGYNRQHSHPMKNNMARKSGGVSGRVNHQQNSSQLGFAPQKGQRVESASRKTRLARQQAASHGTTQKESELNLAQNSAQHGGQNQARQQRLRSQKHTNASNIQTQKTGVISGTPQQVQPTRNGPSSKVGSGNAMGSSEWDMLTMLSQQQQQLKNAQQHFFQNQAMNLEHARKMQLNQDSQKQTNPKETGSRATIGQIQASSLMYQSSDQKRNVPTLYNGVQSVRQSQASVPDSSQPMAANHAAIHQTKMNGGSYSQIRSSQA